LLPFDIEGAMKTLLIHAVAVLMMVSTASSAQTQTQTQTTPPSKDGMVHKLRGNTALQNEASPPLMPKMINDDIRKGRAFAMQPPVIPHQIENYQIDKNFNQCMTCHARNRVAESQAPMVSVTHYMDRGNNFGSEISTRRYFCNQCHVPQYDVKPPVENSFVDAEQATKTKKGIRK
jgi:nitrate reductase (cytochrome), electron transfer subunit